MSSTLDPDNLVPSANRQTIKGHDIKSLGPSDSSDSGSDMAGPGLVNDDILKLDRGTNADVESGSYNRADDGSSVGDLGMSDNSDRYGTGERVHRRKRPARPHQRRYRQRPHVGPAEAGLGGGLDQAEEARLGLTDEELGLEDHDR